jgi:DNA-binding transcriptional regulator LsrR (DeoR family)
MSKWALGDFLLAVSGLALLAGGSALTPPTSVVPARERAEQSLLMHRVAARHFHDRSSNLEISRELGISRFRVARLLEQAVTTGMVNIRVALPAPVDEQLSAQLASAYHLAGACVLAEGGDDRWRNDGIAALALHIVGELLPVNGRLGLAWGRTIENILRTADHLKLDLPNADVVQLVGGVPSNTGGLDASDVVHRCALLTHGRSLVLNAPLLAPTAGVADGLRAERSVAATLSAGETADVALFGIGAWKAGQSQLRDLLTPADRTTAQDSGVAADVCALLISAAGHHVDTKLSRRLIGISVDGLRRIPHRLAAVIGDHKSAATRSVLNSGLVTHIVMDTPMARGLLQ